MLQPQTWPDSKLFCKHVSSSHTVCMQLLPTATSVLCMHWGTYLPFIILKMSDVRGKDNAVIDKISQHSFNLNYSQLHKDTNWPQRFRLELRVI